VYAADLAIVPLRTEDLADRAAQEPWHEGRLLNVEIEKKNLWKMMATNGNNVSNTSKHRIQALIKAIQNDTASDGRTKRDS